MKKGLKFFIAILIGIAVNAAAIGAFILWCKQLEKKVQGTGEIPTPTAGVEGFVPETEALPIETNRFYRVLVEEAGLEIDAEATEPYSEALMREGILKKKI